MKPQDKVNTLLESKSHDELITFLKNRVKGKDALIHHSICWASENGDNNYLIKLAENYRNQLPTISNVPLKIAIQHNQASTVNLLFSLKPNIDMSAMAVRWALQYKQPELLEILKQQNCAGYPAYIAAAMDGQIDDLRTIEQHFEIETRTVNHAFWHVISEQPNEDKLLKSYAYLSQKGIGTNIDESAMIKHFCEEKMFKAVDYLVEQGARIRSIDEDKFKVLVRKKDIRFVTLILDHMGEDYRKEAKQALEKCRDKDSLIPIYEAILMSIDLENAVSQSKLVVSDKEHISIDIDNINSL
ncbi:MAG: hypothetical protein HAW67_00905 [Endozoicomonadaceae bacterium]|nr:hypothetical protein [Endozoicomonadaceae bacterium]